MVLAGAGSGKTRVVTGKIAYLIEEKNVSPYRILAITFTNKAAKEMKDRVARQLGRNIDGMWISTFHAMCVRILRGDIHFLGYDKNFAIYDGADQKTLMKECMKELNLSKEMYNPYGLLSQRVRKNGSITSTSCPILTSHYIKKDPMGTNHRVF